MVRVSIGRPIETLFGSAPCKGAEVLRVQVPPGNWVAPAGSNRSGGGGNETVEASGGKGRLGRLRDQAGRNASER